MASDSVPSDPDRRTERQFIDRSVRPWFLGDEGIATVCRPKIVIHFTLKRTRRDLVLRMARAGSETSIVKFDNRGSYRITAAMLRSNEGNIFGQYDVHFGRRR